MLLVLVGVQNVDVNLEKKIWANMSEERKNYDRHFAPEQSKQLDKSLEDLMGNEPTGCSCHINPPCSYCVGNENEDE